MLGWRRRAITAASRRNRSTATASPRRPLHLDDDVAAVDAVPAAIDRPRRAAVQRRGGERNVGDLRRRTGPLGQAAGRVREPGPPRVWHREGALRGGASPRPRPPRGGGRRPDSAVFVRGFWVWPDLLISRPDLNHGSGRNQDVFTSAAERGRALTLGPGAPPASAAART